MPLRLIVESYQDRPAASAGVLIPELNGFTIGRSDSSDWVLADPEMVLSRKHCVVDYRDDSYYLTDTSVNGVYLERLNDWLEKNQATPLVDGDELVLGTYRIRVELTEEPNEVSLPDAATDLRPPITNADPQTVLEDAPAALIDPFNLTDRPGTRRPAAEALRWRSLDEDSLTSTEVVASPSAAPPIPEPQPATFNGAAAGTQSPPGERTINALLQGAGLENLDLSEEQSVALAREAGLALRQTAACLMEALAERKASKSGMRADSTLLGPTENNPFKATANLDEALTMAVNKNTGAWLGLTEAIHASFDDLKAHENALDGGVGAIIQQLLGMFDPDLIEKSTDAAAGSRWGNRKARYWETYRHYFEELGNNPEVRLEDLLKRTFGRAYDKRQRQAGAAGLSRPQFKSGSNG